MSADHGAAIVVEILEDPGLTRQWRTELDQIRERINSMRSQFSAGMNTISASKQYSYIAQQYGMFSLLPLDMEQLERLKKEYSIYLIPGGRINVAGLAEKNMEHVVNSICAVTA